MLRQKRKRNPEAESKMNEKDDKEFIKELRKVLFAQMPNPADMKQKFRKGLSINNFKNFKHVMEDFHDRKTGENQKKVLAHSCKRDSCQ